MNSPLVFISSGRIVLANFPSIRINASRSVENQVVAQAFFLRLSAPLIRLALFWRLRLVGSEVHATLHTRTPSFTLRRANRLLPRCALFLQLVSEFIVCSRSHSSQGTIKLCPISSTAHGYLARPCPGFGIGTLFSILYPDISSASIRLPSPPDTGASFLPLAALARASIPDRLNSEID